jgi:hypothetical protein
LARALCGVPTERNPPTHPYPGLHPGLVCSAPLGHPIESSPALSRPVEATPNELSTALSRFGGATPMDRRRLYLGLVGQPQWIVDGFISAWWGNPLELSTALFRLVEALLSAVWGQAVCAGRDRLGFEAAGRTPNVLGTGCSAVWGQAVCAGWAGFGDRLLGGTGCCGRTPNVLGTPCCLGTGCVCEMDRFWGQAAGRTPNLLGTGCWE